MLYSRNEILELNIILNNLEKFRNKILEIDYIHDKAKFFDKMKEFRKYLVTLNSGNIFEIFYHSKDYKFYNNFFTNVNEYYIRSLESMQSLSVMTQGIHNFNNFSDVIDKAIIKESFVTKGKELLPLDLSKAKNFVVAGCGPFPETLLYIYENTNIENILGLDYNHEAIYMAGEMMNGIGLDNISFKQVDATKYDYKDADIVSIPIFVNKKSEIINQIIETGKKGVQILVTSPKGFLNLIYRELGSNITPRANITYRKDLSTQFVTQEIIKLEKYNF